jgi:hypothetical protein
LKVSTWNLWNLWNLLTNFIRRRSTSTSEPPFKVLVERVIFRSVLPCVWIDVSIVPRRNGPSLSTGEYRTPKHIINDFLIGHWRVSQLIVFYLMLRVDDWKRVVVLTLKMTGCSVISTPGVST